MDGKIDGKIDGEIDGTIHGKIDGNIGGKLFLQRLSGKWFANSSKLISNMIAAVGTPVSWLLAAASWLLVLCAGVGVGSCPSEPHNCSESSSSKASI